MDKTRKAWTRQKPIVDGRKHCYRCDQWKAVSEFYPEKKSSTGLRARCKACDIAVINESHNNSLDRALRNLAIKNKSNGKAGSKRRQKFTENSCVNPEFLTGLWVTQDGRCAVTDVPMTHVQGAGRRIWTNVTVDRIDPDVGYVEGNVRLVCKAVNYMKNAMSDAEMFQWAALILNAKNYA